MSARRWLCRVVAGVVMVVGAESAPRAAEPWLGSWKIASARLAPWVDRTHQPDTTDRNELLGKTVMFKPYEIAGPAILACKTPKYRLSDFSADMLFQGAFGEMRQKDEAVDPAKIAASLGFKGESWQVLETGCANDIDWQFIDDATLAIGFNDYVYVLKKQ